MKDVCVCVHCVSILVFVCVHVYVDCKPKLKTMCFCDTALNAACTLLIYVISSARGQ